MNLSMNFGPRNSDPSVDQDILEVLNSDGFLNVKKKKILPQLIFFGNVLIDQWNKTKQVMMEK